MNKVRVSQLHKLLRALSVKTGQVLSQKTLRTISEQIDGIGDDYLYKKIYNPIQHRRKNEMMALRSDQLNCVARYLGHVDFASFVTNLAYQRDDQLISLIGSYYCYVRSNAVEGESILFRSPVRIWEGKDKKVWFELKGPSQQYHGEIRNRDGCIFVLMESESGKCFHHVYKVGKRNRPQVIQGTFSGVSTAFDPIGGRVVLVRQEVPYPALINDRLDLQVLARSPELLDQKLAKYFRYYENNNVVPNRSSSFGLEDLG